MNSQLLTASSWHAQWLDPLQLVGMPPHVLVHYRQSFLTGAEGKQLFPLTQVDALDLPIISKQGLGMWEGIPVVLYEVAQAVSIEGSDWLGLRQIMSSQLDSSYVEMLCTAAQVGTWVSQHRFCGHCGTPLLAAVGERAMVCPQCHNRYYPRISPCMIALVTRGDEVLLARSPRHAPGVFSTLAGFVEPGETIEQCVTREVLEEVGVQVTQPRYITSQSWPFPHSLMLGFHVQYVRGDIRLQPEEIEEAQWFPLSALPNLPGPHTIARHLIDCYLAERLGSNRPI